MKINEQSIMKELLLRQLCADCGLVWENSLPRVALRSIPEGLSLHRVEDMFLRDTGIRPRVYPGTDLAFRGIYLGDRAFLLCGEDLTDWMEKEYLQPGVDPAWFGSMEYMNRLSRELGRYRLHIVDQRVSLIPGREYFTEDAPEQALPAGMEIRDLSEADLYDWKEAVYFRHAVSGSHQMPSVMACSIHDGSKTIACAGATADSDILWQIGVDTHPAMRGRGLGSLLVRRLAKQILEKGKVPFYQTCSSHIGSVKCALKAGFVPAWTESYCAGPKGR